MLLKLRKPLYFIFACMVFQTVILAQDQDAIYEITNIRIVGNDKTKELFRLWNQQINQYSHRDQISLPYVIDQLNIKKYFLMQQKLLM